MLVVTSIITNILVQQRIVAQAEGGVTLNGKIGVEIFEAVIGEKELFLDLLISDYLKLPRGMSFEEEEDFLKSKDDVDETVLGIFIGKDNGELITSIDFVQDSTFVLEEREWYKGAFEKDGLYLTLPYLDVTGEVVITMSKPIIEDGEFKGIVGIDIDTETIYEQLRALENPEGNYIFICNNKYQIVMHPTEELNPTEDKVYTLQDGERDYKDVIDARFGTVKTSTNFSGESVYSVMYEIEGTDWMVMSSYPTKLTTESLISQIIISIIVGIASVLVNMVVINWFNKKFISPIDKIVEGLYQMQQGQLDIDMGTATKTSREIELLVQGMVNISIVWKDYINEISMVLKDFSDGNYTTTPKQNYVGDFTTIKSSLIDIAKHLKELLQDTTRSANEINDGSEKLAMSAENLAAFTVEQADLLENFSGSTKNITEMILDSMKELEKSYLIVNQMSHKAVDSKQIMTEMINAMQAINQSTNTISEVITIIDSIAQQTNLLALNAAIEAARAGESGKGFAVVAGEIRELATKSAETVKEIHAIIGETQESVKRGEQIVALTSDALDSIVDSIEENVNISAIIKENSENQKTSLDEIIKGTSELSQGISKNSAIAQENVAISEELAGHSTKLKEQMDKFKIN